MNNKFNITYTKYKNLYQIDEGNAKQLIPGIQQNILKSYFDNQPYNQLSDQSKQKVDNLIKETLDQCIDIINQITTNKQYQSWLYDQIRETDISLTFDLLIYRKEHFIEMFNSFNNICKSQKISSNQKNIMNYKSITDLEKFIKDNKDLLIKKQKADFKKVCGNNLYDVYAIYLKDKYQFQQIYGEAGYNVGWCVVNSEKNMFESYLEQSLTPNDCYYLWTYKGTNKPFALLHFDSNQFKDIHNDCMLEYDDEIYQCLLKLMKIHNITWSDCSGDLTSYRYIYYYKNKQLGQLIVTDDELAIYLADEHLDLPADCYVLTNGDEHVVGYFSIDNYNYAGGLGQSKQPTILFLIYKLRPGIFIKLCKQVGQPFDNQLFINDMKNNNCFDFVNLITHASNVQVKWTEHDYQILLASGYYILYNKKENRYLAYGEFVNKRFYIGNPMNINKPQNIDKNIADIFIKGMKKINNNIIID